MINDTVDCVDAQEENDKKHDIRFVCEINDHKY